jgi:predicted dehydrogenase
VSTPAGPGDGPAPKRVAISGCGAVTRLYYAPALNKLAAQGAVALAAVFDPDQQAAGGVAAGFAGAAVADSLELLLTERPDLVFVASPPAVHEEQVAACLESGADVLCEKPLCLSGEAARRLQAAADRTGRNLWVGLVRRQFPATQAIRDLVASGAIGRIEDVKIFEGGPFRWPIRSQLYFSREFSGGGVFQDLGAHAVDLLTWWFGQPLDLDYEDDASGGVEANCRLIWHYAGFEAVLRLSRDWARPNRYLVRGSLGTIAWSVDEPDRVELIYEGRTSGMDLVAQTGTKDADGRPLRVDFHSCFAAQIAAAAGRPDAAALVPVREAVPGIEIIEEAYRRRRPLPQPWMGEAIATGAAW